jgi:hypothetical protein
MEQGNFLAAPNLVCKTCGIPLSVTCTEKRPVSEFYAIHPEKGTCPLKDEMVRIDPAGNIIGQEIWKENGKLTYREPKSRKAKS